MATMAEPRWLNAEEQQAWRAFLAANRLLIEALDRELQRDAGLPHTYYEILVQLSESPERTMRMSDLAARSLSSRSRLSHAVARLEEAGWVRRETCPTDKRGQLAVLTDEQKKQLEEMKREGQSREERRPLLRPRENREGKPIEKREPSRERESP